MKVLILGSSWKIGLTHYLTLLSIALKRRGLKVVVLSSSKEQDKGLRIKLKENGIKYYQCDYIESISPWGIWRGSREVKRIVDSESIKVIHTQGLLHSVVCYLGCNLFSKKVTIVQSFRYDISGLFSWRILVKLINLMVDIVIPVSERIKEGLIKRGLPSKKCIIIPNAVDIEKVDSIIFSSSSVNPTIIYPASTLDPLKGHFYFLHAASMVLREFPDARFVITGEGNKEELFKLVEELNIKEKVIFKGRVEYDDIIRLLSKSSICAYPSLMEGLPKGILDAMAVYKPVVGSAVGGIPEVIRDGETGFLVPPGDSEALADKIVELLRKPELIKKMGERGRRMVEEEFSIDVVARRLEKVYLGIR